MSEKIKLGDYVSIKTGKLDANASKTNGQYPFFTCSIQPLRIDNYSYDCECVLVAGNGDLNVKYYNGKFDAYQRTYIIESINKKVMNNRYLYYLINSKIEHLRNNSIGGVIKYIKLGNLTNIEFNKIDIQKQEECVNLLDKMQEIIDIRKTQIEKLDELIKSQFVEMFGNIEKQIELKEYITSLDAGKSLAGEEECINKVLKTGSVSYDYFNEEEVKNLPVNYIPKKEHKVNAGDVIISRMNTTELVGAVGYVWKVKDNVYIPDRLWKANLKNGTNPIFIWQLLIQNDMKEQIQRICSGTSGSMKNIAKEKFLKLKVKEVPISLQNKFAEFVKQIDKQKFEVQKSLEEIQKLQESLMNKYFG